MGQKVNPIGLRIGFIQDWRSRWFANKNRYAQFLEEDIKIRRFLTKSLVRAGISRIEIEREDKSLTIDIYTARPGIIIGKGGTEVDRLKSAIEKMVKKDVQISVAEVKRPELDANLIAQAVSEQLIGRVPFRRAMKRAVSAAMRGGAQGIRISCSGRLGGAEMARREWYREGRVPLHTLKADIDYGYCNARTTFGSIGVKVWIYKGDVVGRRLAIAKEKEKKEEALGLLTARRKQAAVDDMADKVGAAADDLIKANEELRAKQAQKEATPKKLEEVEAEAKAEPKTEEKTEKKEEKPKAKKTTAKKAKKSKEEKAKPKKEKKEEEKKETKAKKPAKSKKKETK